MQGVEQQWFHISSKKEVSSVRDLEFLSRFDGCRIVEEWIHHVRARPLRPCSIIAVGFLKSRASLMREECIVPKGVLV